MITELRGLLRTAVSSHGGVEVDATGDELLAVFPLAPRPSPARSPASARSATTTGRTAHAFACGWASTPATPALSDEGYVGIDVIRAARIAAAGHGGQILLSSTSAAFVTDVEVKRPRDPPARGPHRPRAGPPGRDRRPAARLPRRSGTPCPQLGDGRRVVDRGGLRAAARGRRAPARGGRASRSSRRPGRRRTCCATSRCTSPTSRWSTSGCRRRTPTRASGPRARSVSVTPRPASSSSPSTSRRRTRSSCSRAREGVGYLLKDRVVGPRRVRDRGATRRRRRLRARPGRRRAARRSEAPTPTRSER